MYGTECVYREVSDEEFRSANSQHNKELLLRLFKFWREHLSTYEQELEMTRREAYGREDTTFRSWLVKHPF